LPTDFDEELRLAIARVGGQKQVALKMEMSEAELSRKINGERGFKLDELKKLFEILDLKIGVNLQDDDRVLVKLLAKKLSEVML
jgi:DNA-binding phage protein